MRLSLLKHPAAGTTDADPLGTDTVIVQDGQCGKSVLFQKGIHLRLGGPPVIVVALHQDFLSRKIIQKSKVCPGFFETHAPRHIARNHNGIFLVYNRPPVFFQTLHIVFPAAKNVHRLVDRQRQVGISDHKKRHVSVPFQSVKDWGHKFLRTFQINLFQLIKVADQIQLSGNCCKLIPVSSSLSPIQPLFLL